LIHAYNHKIPTASSPIDGELPDYDGFLLEFPRDIDGREQELIRGCTCYAAFIPWFSNGTDFNEWISPRHFWIDASSYRSRSHDWRARDPFTVLADYIINGTPARSRADGTRRWEGVGVAPIRIILNHPGDVAPALEIENIHFEREGRQPPPQRVITDARDLLRMR
jgi:hypothetical protein